MSLVSSSEQPREICVKCDPFQRKIEPVPHDLDLKRVLPDHVVNKNLTPKFEKIESKLE